MGNTKHEDEIMKMGFDYFRDNIVKMLGIDYEFLESAPTELVDLTRREQEIPHFYKWWDELRLTRRFLDFRILLYYNVFTNQSYLTERI